MIDIGLSESDIWIHYKFEFYNFYQNFDAFLLEDFLSFLCLEGYFLDWAGYSYIC